MIFLSGGLTNVVGFPALLLLQRYFPDKATSSRVTFFASFLCLASMIIWTDWSGIVHPHDICQQATCTYSLERRIICPLNQSAVACTSLSDQCVWMQNGTFGACDSCPLVCRDPSKTLNSNI